MLYYRYSHPRVFAHTRRAECLNDSTLCEKGQDQAAFSMLSDTVAATTLGMCSHSNFLWKLESMAEYVSP